MKKLFAIALIVSLVGIVRWITVTQGATPSSEPEENYDSPSLAELAKQLTGDSDGNQAAIDQFVGHLQGKAPLVESVVNDPHSAWVTFLWRSEGTVHRVGVLGGPPTADFAAKLERLKETDLWYRTDKVPNDARFVYRFLINQPENIASDPAAWQKFWKEHPPASDPLNPHDSPSGDGSIAELPDAPPQPWLERLPGVSNQITGWLEKNLANRDIREFTIHSEILKQDRTFAAYTPPGYNPQGEPYTLLVMFDGNGCRQANSSFPVSVILDNLISQKKIAPLVTVFVYQTAERDKELACSETFADFVAQELIPRVRKDYHVATKAEQTIISGLSLGGLMSSFCAYRHPEVFGNVLSMSGSYPWCPGMFEGTMNAESEPGWLTRQFVESPKLPIHFYLTAGRFENFHPYSLLNENRRLRDVLKAKSYTVDYSEFSGGHNPVCWRGPFVEGLIKLIGQPELN